MRSGTGSSVSHHILSAEHNPDIKLNRESIFALILLPVVAGKAKVAVEIAACDAIRRMLGPGS